MYSATITDSTGNEQCGILSSEKKHVVHWMQTQKKLRKMRDKRLIFFRKAHDPVFKSKDGYTMTCDFLLTKRI